MQREKKQSCGTESSGKDKHINREKKKKPCERRKFHCGTSFNKEGSLIFSNFLSEIKVIQKIKAFQDITRAGFL